MTMRPFSHLKIQQSTNPAPRDGAAGLTHFKCMGGKMETRHEFHEFKRQNGVFIGKSEDFAIDEGKRRSDLLGQD